MNQGQEKAIKLLTLALTGLLALIIASPTRADARSHAIPARAFARARLTRSDIIRRKGQFGGSPGGLQTYSASGPLVVYVNMDGVSLTQSAVEDATTNQSPDPSCTVPPSEQTPTDRKATMEAVKLLLGPYNIKVVTTRPVSGGYSMMVVGGCPDICGHFARDSGVGGVAGLDCGNTAHRDIGYIFETVYFERCGSIPLGYTDHERIWGLAQAIVHEFAHTLGLPHTSHEDAVCDLMSYGTCTGGFDKKRFLDQQMELAKRSSGQYDFGCSTSTTLNTHQMMLAVAGPNLTAPQVTIVSPADKASVDTSSVLEVTAADDLALESVEVLIDGISVETRETPATDSLKFTLNLTPGPHIVTVVGRDGAANRGDATVRVMTVGPTAPAEPAGPSDPAPSAPTEPNPGQRPAQLYGGCALSPNLASSAKDTSPPLLLLALGLLGALRRRRQRSGSR